MIELTPSAPFNFELALKFLRHSPSAILEKIHADGSYRRVFNIRNVDVLVVLRSLGTPKNPRLCLEVPGSNSDLAIEEHASAIVQRIFSLDVDSSPFVALCSKDKVFGTVLNHYRGLRPVLIPDPYEALLWSIIGQQVNVAFAKKLKIRLVSVYGHNLTIDEESYPCLPRPETLASLSEQELRALQFSRQKAAYLINLSKAVRDGDLQFSILNALPHLRAIEILMSFKGIGRWTAEYVLSRAFGAPDSIPAADIGLRTIIGRAYGIGRVASEMEVRAIAQSWSGWRGWASFYWWFYLQSTT